MRKCIKVATYWRIVTLLAIATCMIIVVSLLLKNQIRTSETQNIREQDEEGDLLSKWSAKKYEINLRAKIYWYQLPNFLIPAPGALQPSFLSGGERKSQYRVSVHQNFGSYVHPWHPVFQHLKQVQKQQ